MTSAGWPSPGSGAGLVAGAFVAAAVALRGGERGEALVAMALIGPFLEEYHE